MLDYKNPRQWENVWPQAEFAYNHVPNCSSGKSPFEVIYIHPLLHTSDLVPLPKLLEMSIITAHLIDKVIDVHGEVKKKFEEFVQNTISSPTSTKGSSHIKWVTMSWYIYTKNGFPRENIISSSRQRLVFFVSFKKLMIMSISSIFPNSMSFLILLMSKI